MTRTLLNNHCFFLPVRGFAASLRLIAFSIFATLIALSQPAIAQASPETLDPIAERYVILALQYARHEPGYVNGDKAPKPLVEAARAKPLSLEELAAESRKLLASLPGDRPGTTGPSRARFLRGQLQALAGRIAFRQGKLTGFTKEAEAYFGVRLKLRPLTAYDPLIAEVGRLIPGDAPLADRVLAFRKRFEIPPARLASVMNAAIAACRTRTLRHIALPPDESVSVGYVTGKPWTGIANYIGQNRTKIEINSELPDSFAHVMMLACHEAYPGHHVQNILREIERNRPGAPVELGLFPLFSPMNVLTEGTASFGKDLAFPREEQIKFTQEVLAPLAGLKPEGFATLHRLEEISDELLLAQINIGAELVEDRIDRPTAEKLLQHYGLMDAARAKRAASFLLEYRSFILNYSVGARLVADYVRRTTRTEAERWAALSALSGGKYTTADLLGPHAPTKEISIP